jgi:Alkylmercury lyase
VIDPAGPGDDLATDVRVELFRVAAATGHVPQAPDLARALGRAEDEVRDALRRLAAARVLILAPNDGDIWAANPFCAVPSGFRVDCSGRIYWGICIWDALGIAAALDADAVITAPCGDCGAPMALEVRGRRLVRGEGRVHFAVPAHRWWDNIGFT